ncbi:leucine-rich repeat domain-containing protein [Kitasatospora sp. NPDC092039]|uniref:leucine-rich repeat domain-containing protein n=1 Tax=Kitasatospora sp. NPDC092039 TaxID=3364086 RepID=UPI0038093978
MPTSAVPASLSYADADARLGGALSTVFEGAGASPGYRKVLFFDGDLTLDGDFLAAVDELRGGDAEGDIELIVVTGDLTVDGRIALYDDRPGLYVGGRTEAETLEGGEAEIHIHDGAFTHLVHGYYNHGSLVAGIVETPWVIYSDHHMELSAPGARWVDNHGDDDDADFAVGDGIAEAFVPEVVDAEDHCLDVDAFLDRLRAGIPVLRPGARSAAESAGDVLSRALADRVEHLDLTDRRLRAFPAEVLRMPWLRTLILDGNPIGELPEALGTLTRLEHLSVRYCGLTALPESVGDLAALRVLCVAGNRDPDGVTVEFSLPAAVGRLTALEELDISYLSVTTGATTTEWDLPEMTRFVLPDTFGGLVALRKLVADVTDVVFPDSAHGLTGIEEVSMTHGRLRTFPEAVTTFPNLRRLDLSDNFFDTVPDSLLRLTRLEELDLGGSLGLVRDPLPDLGRLPALRVLGFSGHTSRFSAPEPGHVFLRELFAMELAGLEELRIDRWCRNTKRHKPGPEHFTGIGTFRRLRTVDMSSNELRDLPADFDTLPDLAVVDLRYNRLPQTVRDRITAAHPTARIDFQG